MIEDIYNEFEEKSFETLNRSFDIKKTSKNDKKKKIRIQKKNVEFQALLKYFGIPHDDSSPTIYIEKYYETIVKLGILLGIKTGPEYYVQKINNKKMDLDELITKNPESCVSFNELKYTRGL